MECFDSLNNLQYLFIIKHPVPYRLNSFKYFCDSRTVNLFFNSSLSLVAIF